MLYQSDDLVLAHAKQRRQQLQDEAQAHRQARCIRAARTASAATGAPSVHHPTFADRLLHAAGAQLVRWGTRLQQRSATRQVTSATFVDTRPA